MKERLISFMQEMNLSSGQLADQIGVQRSGISHILSGRNKPSYDFIQKFLTVFPDVNAAWFITGEGPMLKNGSRQDLFYQSMEEGKDSGPTVQKQDETLNVTQPNREKATTHEQKDPSRVIREVMVFYTDGTVDIYKPGE